MTALQKALEQTNNFSKDECQTLDSLITALRDGSLEYDLMEIRLGDLQKISDKSLSALCIAHQQNSIDLRNKLEAIITNYNLEDVF